MTIIYVLFGVTIFLLLAIISTVAKIDKKTDDIKERLEDVEDVLVEVKGNTEPEREEDVI